ncbi:hypothetical protein C7U92_18965 [Bradyrhizobium sp. WBOS7]|uniref:Prolyl 4-hydroxylase alpha subunit Fe(2+) 2OG dioxygenase domain-containing protein n=1 Tax=Bradyrhizobium betae TaxID=244734 RepID=A0AAE9NIY1_9BRAD|nr:hypothetical protein [Bradyrhizobium sp. WBOS2]MDD1573308.1 hypothetical protein [Bradyrhizobium sp. WBOS1]MDD1578790.1 hypothetical protein [Bradyrhizobium sp. WBOS7]MDD1602223.1 hypothetical protein [Bradyrhizobium sp. WBOS16]UUO39196.1 hypothetical protein DCK84_25790 [Bradyrhizobium sp. WBOS01]UUO44987.1 hypothetical protein DCM75_03430 [Bradyrhizobium sp. WBOS02]UUO57218.1 hypothetical protein DCM79_03335 [Bradyrhizobium sp. WBOS07]UUO69909.1 hypothetical protein DCM83_29745 [Bradyrh
MSGLFARVDSLRDEYVAAKPWPHIVVNDAFPERLLDMAAAECTALQEARLITTNTDCLVKQEISDGLGTATQHLLNLVDSARFREFISAVTGVRDLLCDPTHKFAGIHRTPPGGFTKIHRDFEVHPTTGLFHRVNLLVYLNRDWPEAYGGSLELWPADMSALGCRIFPRFNTMILWETHGATLHGLPDPVTCPPDRMRLSVASYYYTTTRRVAASGERRVRYWAARPGEDQAIERMCWQDHLRTLIPDPLYNVLRSARDRISGVRRSKEPKLASFSGNSRIDQ